MVEMVAALLGLIQGGLVWANKRLNWVFYCLQYIFMAIFSISARLYGDITNCVFYFIIGVAGWFLWGREKGSVPIRHCSKRERTVYIPLTACCVAVLYVILRQTNDPLPLLDAVTTVTGYAATYYMLTKKVDAWALWLVNDILYVVEYFMLPERAWYLMILNFIWCFMAVGSWIAWNKAAKEYEKNLFCGKV